MIGYGYFMDLSLSDHSDYVVCAEDVVNSSENRVRSGVESEFSVQWVKEKPKVSKVKWFHSGSEKGLFWVTYFFELSFRGGSVVRHVKSGVEVPAYKMGNMRKFHKSGR